MPQGLPCRSTRTLPWVFEPTLIPTWAKCNNCAQKSLRITQNKYIESILEKWGMKDTNSIKVPIDPKLQLEQSDSTKLGYSTAYTSLIGSLMYAAIATCPNIVYTISQLASFTVNSNMSHWMAAKWVLRYSDKQNCYNVWYFCSVHNIVLTCMGI